MIFWTIVKSIPFLLLNKVNLPNTVLVRKKKVLKNCVVDTNLCLCRHLFKKLTIKQTYQNSWKFHLLVKFILWHPNCVISLILKIHETTMQWIYFSAFYTIKKMYLQIQILKKSTLLNAEFDEIGKFVRKRSLFK